METENNNLIAFQGELGAYSHLACKELYPSMEAVPCSTFDGVFSSVANNEASFALVPIENSVVGRVGGIHHLFHKYDLSIIKEYFLEIHHQLLVKKGVNLSEIKFVRSHIMALDQCSSAIDKLGLKTIPAADTAGSAKHISKNNNRDQSAIASTLAATIYELDIIKSNIENEKHNTTRFLILSKNKPIEREKDKEYITSCIFEVKSVPAALYKALGGFATNGVNLTKLESFYVGVKFTQAQFYIDFEGHIDDQNVKRALDELSFITTKMKILGVYLADDHRFI